ncbi:MAG: hypothetical protein DPW14_12130 [Planctomycetes bacterium]|nr:hypothetical protein [Planctomycetota bacterium]
MENYIPCKVSLQRGELTAPQPRRPKATLPQLADQRDLQGVIRLLEQGEYPDDQDSYGKTALHWAVLRDEVEIVRVLLQHGASARIKDHRGQTPWSIAEKCRPDALIIQMLLERRLDRAIRDEIIEEGRSKIFPM